MDSIQELREAFASFSYSLVEGRCISVSYQWNIKTAGVEGIRVALRGRNPLTGDPIPDTVIATLSPAKQSVKSQTLAYDGKFLMHFDALDRYGNVLFRDFNEPIAVQLKNPAKRPIIEYSTAAVKHGWTQMTIRTNCAERCREKLWAFYDDHYQLMPALKNSSNVFYLPTTDRELKLFLNKEGCEDMQQPRKVKG